MATGVQSTVALSSLPPTLGRAALPFGVRSSVALLLGKEVRVSAAFVLPAEGKLVRLGHALAEALATDDGHTAAHTYGGALDVLSLSAVQDLDEVTREDWMLADGAWLLPLGSVDTTRQSARCPTSVGDVPPTHLTRSHTAVAVQPLVPCCDVGVAPPVHLQALATSWAVRGD